MDIEWLLDGGYLPTPLIRLGIRRQLAQREALIQSESLSAAYERKMSYIAALRERPMAIETDTANTQHYEVGTGVLQGMLGPRMKYSCCLYPIGEETLGHAEVEMLKLYVERAELRDGMKILDLGCGWGSLCLYLAERFPSSSITAFSNSRTQRAYIESVAQSKNLTNLSVLTGNIVTYTFPSSLHSTYDRILSIELFEHMKNYRLLFRKLHPLLKPATATSTAKLFIHIFAHCSTPYDFESGWMTTHFFTGGTMPSADLLHFFQEAPLQLARQWWVSGLHYSRTCEDWLREMNGNKDEIWPHLEETYGKDEARKWFYRWQIFYLACSELFKWKGGDVWGVSHYLFEKC